MPINLKDHAVFIDRLQMDMVPLSIAEKALEEVAQSTTDISSAMSLIQQSLSEINKTIDPND